MQTQPATQKQNLQGELFARATLPRSLPVYKPTPEDERATIWKDAPHERQATH